jgi:MFS family permease
VSNKPLSTRRSVVIATLGFFQILAWGSSFYLLSVLALPIAEDTGWPTTIVIGGVSLAMLIAGFASPRVGKIIQVQGGRPVMAFSAVTFAAGLAIMGLAPVLPVYLAAWVLIGFGMATGLYDPAFATLGRIYGQAARPMITTVTLFGGFASTVCWPVTALLLESFGWRWACLAYAAAHLFLALPAYLLLLPARAPGLVAADYTDGVKSALPANKEATALWVVGIILTTSGAMLALVSMHLLALLQTRGLELAAAVAFGALVGPSQVAARVVELTFGRFYHPLWTMLVGVSLVTIGVLLLWMEVPVIAAALITYGAGNGIISITRGSVPLVLFGSDRFAITMGRLALPSLLAMAAAPTIGTLLIEKGGASLTFLVLTSASALNVALAIVLIVGFRR